MRARAERAGLSIARYVKRLVERDLSRGGTGFTALAPGEQRELLETMREIHALLREGPAEDREAAGGAPECLSERAGGGLGRVGGGGPFRILRERPDRAGDDPAALDLDLGVGERLGDDARRGPHGQGSPNPQRSF